MRLETTLTSQHIARGEALECTSCPVALAVTEELGGRAQPGSVSVTRQNVTFRSSGGRVYRADTTAEVAAFVRDFDAGADVEPFAFTLTFRALPSVVV